MQNQLRLLQPNPRQYKAEMVLNNQIQLSTVNFANKVNCIRGLNEQIRRYEMEKGLSLPRLPANGETVYFELTGKRAKIVHLNETNPTKPDNAQDPIPKKKQATASQAIHTLWFNRLSRG
ncbi:hypothetical protein [Rodentibacter genomosp. 2]|uniref:hypothetical protein n=1 Tax=Rodentibacter genomosp. 2 TaxID=1908266 RepID=UPI000986F55B